MARVANLRVIDVDELKSVPHVPVSHPFIERLIGTIRREYLDRVFFWNAVDLTRKLNAFGDYYNALRVHRSLDGTTPAQRAGASSPAPPRPSYPLVWDYHVVALARESGSSDWAVFDPDSTLPWGLSARTYLAETFPPEIELLPEYQPCLRWFDGREYQRRLNATRRHMRNADGTWQAPPPLWPLIRSKAPDAFDVPELRNADCRTLPPPLDLSQLYSLLCSGAAPAAHS